MAAYFMCNKPKNVYEMRNHIYMSMTSIFFEGLESCSRTLKPSTLVNSFQVLYDSSSGMALKMQTNIFAAKLILFFFKLLKRVILYIMV